MHFESLPLPEDKIMAGLNFMLMNFFAAVVFSILMSGCGVMAAASPVKAAYWPSWNVDFPPSYIDTSLFTHIYYAFLMPNNVTLKFDISEETAFLLSNFTTILRHKSPPVQTLASFGGASSDPALFAKMASSASSRGSFINSAIEIGRKFGFDGLDLDWEHPKTPKEMQDLGYLLDEWRVAINKEAKATRRSPLLLTAAVYFAADFFISEVYRTYPIPSITKNMDWINAMCYDYHGGWDTSVTGAHAALFDLNSNLSTSYGLKSWIKAGVPRNMLVMGFPLYGKSWKLKDPNSNGVGAPSVDVGPGNGEMPYSQVEEFNSKNGATVVHDLETVSVYSFVGTIWIGYDDAISATVKMEFAQALGIRGYFFWSVDGDNDWKISKQAFRAWIDE